MVVATSGSVAWFVLIVTVVGGLGSSCFLPRSSHVADVVPVALVVALKLLSALTIRLFLSWTLLLFPQWLWWSVRTGVVPNVGQFLRLNVVELLLLWAGAAAVRRRFGGGGIMTGRSSGWGCCWGECMGRVQ